MPKVCKRGLFLPHNYPTTCPTIDSVVRKNIKIYTISCCLCKKSCILDGANILTALPPKQRQQEQIAKKTKKHPLVSLPDHPKVGQLALRNSHEKRCVNAGKNSKKYIGKLLDKLKFDLLLFGQESHYNTYKTNNLKNHRPAKIQIKKRFITISNHH